MPIEPLKQAAPLTPQQMTQISEAYTRFLELRQQTIVTPTTSAELKGLSEFLAQSLIDHAGEFIGCWFAIRNEYEPIIGLITRVSQRVIGLNAQQHAQLIASHAGQQRPESADSKIVTLDTKGS